MSQLLDRFLYICLVRYKKFLYVWFVLMGFYMNGSLWQVCLSLAWQIYFIICVLWLTFFVSSLLWPVTCLLYTWFIGHVFCILTWFDCFGNIFFGLIWSPRVEYVVFSSVLRYHVIPTCCRTYSETLQIGQLETIPIFNNWRSQGHN